MRIFFDHQTFSLQDFGGISRYYTEVIRGINQTSDNEAYLSVLLSNNIHIKEAALGVNSLFPNYNLYKKSNIIYKINQLYTVSKLKSEPFDIFHPTYYDPYFISNLKRQPFVVTFLDMIQEKFAVLFPEFDDGGVTVRQKQLLAERANRIIAISESTKNDIVELLHIDSAKIDVIYLGNSLKPVSSEITERIIPEPYLLFVGRRERYKNFEGLIKAIHPLLKKYELKLVCAGGGPFTDRERTLIHTVGADASVQQLPVNDQTLPQFYQQSVAFIFPTMYEGFGIPVLEAFACDCPCIVSNLSSLPEVAGDAALYVDPTSSDSISSAVERLLSDSQLRQTLVEKGREQLSRFSWQRTVDETLELYRTIT